VLATIVLGCVPISISRTRGIRDPARVAHDSANKVERVTNKVFVCYFCVCKNTRLHR
jgi:hypothetical protein